MNFNFSVFFWVSFPDYLKPYLNHSFQKVRERLGSIFINIFESDLNFVGAAEPECPRIKNMMAEVVEKIQILKQEMPALIKCTSTDSTETDNSEYQQAVRIFKTSKSNKSIQNIKHILIILIFCFHF